jgi:iron-sulfur cluster protein
MKRYNIKLADGSIGNLVKTSDKSIFYSKDYKFTFDKKSGMFVRWGETTKDNGKLELGLPEIADIEISTICNGINGIPCSFCYKGNTGTGTYMNFDTFKKVFHNLPPTITQIAFGIGDIEGNPDMWDIFDYCNINGIVPNVTVNGEGITEEIADKLVSKCGAVAVSLYDFDKTYDTIKSLTDKGLQQVNIHFMLSLETYPNAIKLMKNYKSDDRLKKLNSIVFLSLKQQGRAKRGYTILKDDYFKSLVNYALDNEIPIGFDSCSAQKFLKSVKDHEKYELLEQLSEPCESTIYSMYINVEGKFFPCSFVENTDGWYNGLDIVNTNDFLKEIWYDDSTKLFREKVINCRNCNESCAVYKI